MGILKIKPSAEPAPYEYYPRVKPAPPPAPLPEDEPDPYDIFFQPERRRRWPNLIAQGAVVLTFIAAILGGAHTLQRYWWSTVEEAAAHPFVYFEVKVIDPAGHPVAGAMVEKGSERLGVTDSFGEWRRFLRVPLGTTQRFVISKPQRAGQLRAEKNFAIPPEAPKHGDVEVKASVALEVIVDQPRDQVGTTPKDVKPAEALASAAVLETPKEKAVASGNYDQVWIVAPTADDRLAGVVKAMNERVVQLGIRLDPDSPWTLKISQLALDGQGGEPLLAIESSHSELGRQVFLRNFKGSHMETARGILWAASLQARIPFHVERLSTGASDGRWVIRSASPTTLWQPSAGQIVENEAGHLFEVDSESVASGFLLKQASGKPCPDRGCVVHQADLASRPPIPGASPLQVRVLGHLGDDLELFVAGFQARRLNDGLYSYWGQASGSANVTAVAQGRIVYRGRLTASRTAVPRLVIPKQRLSRR